ncbi:MAG TPA: acetyl-CoA carboxylase biotin carboxylase subunit [candidate division Zixibacteria bacterium]|nr:acetyl-CoA carboxylase biotin carboxylase subunit [candidate division Zixibacteria bacterium]
MFKKILIANRGEIAVRIIRACKELDITAAVIYSEADRKSLHVRMADEAYLVGPAEASASYLNAEKITRIAKEIKAEAIHPGYGFLAENANFAELVQTNGLVFIGPPPSAMKLAGDKLQSRKIFSEAGIPIMPGSNEISNEKVALNSAEKLGYPVLLKASAGGGGKGMRIVRKTEEMRDAFRGAKYESKIAFGDDRIYLEKFLERPRHIEIQILADSFGNYGYLGERECSIQRRHQKLIEESPSVIVDENLRKKMGETAVKIAQLVGYVNAGTVEFLMVENKNFYFLEMNTRLQVEHPVTEMVTGIDIAKRQIRIASGEKLDFSQSDIKPFGHALECRIYAEDYQNNFFPSTGVISLYREPAGPGVRVDSGVYEGFEIPLYYDPLIAKLICWGQDRNEAISRMSRALSEYQINGITSTIEFHQKVMQNEKFKKGEISTNFIEEGIYPKLKEEEKINLDYLAVSAALADYLATKKVETEFIQNGAVQSIWKRQARITALRGKL